MKKILFFTLSALILGGCSLYQPHVKVSNPEHPNPTIPEQNDFDYKNPEYDLSKVYCDKPGYACSHPGLRPQDLAKVAAEKK